MEDRRLLAYCGLYCGDCAGYSGAIADAAGDLIRILERYEFRRTAKCLFAEQISDYEGFHESLAFIAELRCPKICRNRRDDETDCEIRACCINKGLYACHECADFEVCSRLKGHEALHGDACVRNLKAIKDMGLEAWIAVGERLWFGSTVDHR
jgi:hypothetical protein